MTEDKYIIAKDKNIKEIQDYLKLSENDLKYFIGSHKLNFRSIYNTSLSEDEKELLLKLWLKEEVRSYSMYIGHDTKIHELLFKAIKFNNPLIKTDTQMMLSNKTSDSLGEFLIDFLVDIDLDILSDKKRFEQILKEQFKENKDKYKLEYISINLLMKIRVIRNQQMFFSLIIESAIKKIKEDFNYINIFTDNKVSEKLVYFFREKKLQNAKIEFNNSIILISDYIRGLKDVALRITCEIIETQVKLNNNTIVSSLSADIINILHYDNEKVILSKLKDIYKYSEEDITDIIAKVENEKIREVLLALR